MVKALRNVTYDNNEFTSVNSLYAAHLKDPVAISNDLTYLYGKDSDRFPLLSMTDGQKGGWTSIAPNKELGDTQYYWNVQGKMKLTSRVVSLSQTTATSAPGAGYIAFKVIMEDDKFKQQYGATAPDGTRCRIQRLVGRTSAGYYEYELVSKDGTAVGLGNFMKGKAWVITAPTIPALLSDGNQSDRMFPGKMTNQFGYHRFSKGIAGNIENQVVNIQFDLEGGGTTNKWMPYEMYQFELLKRQLLEEHLLESKYNRDDNGKIYVTDLQSGGEVVPEGSGIFEMISEVGNEDTYTTLSIAKLDNTVNAVFDGLSDTTAMEIVLYTGNGGAKAFHDAVMSDASSKLFYQVLGDKMVTGGEGTGYLQYGAYFNQYKTFRGHIITVRPCNYFDWGSTAVMQRANGEMVGTWPLNSFTMLFLDQSSVDGKRNVMTVNELGRENQIGIYKGMSPLPGSWGALNEIAIADRKDVAWYENITSKGINMYRANTSFVLRRA